MKRFANYNRALSTKKNWTMPSLGDMWAWRYNGGNNMGEHCI